MRFFRKIFFLFLLASLFWPSLAARGAESITDPAFNTLCWRKADCVKAREEFLRLDPNAKAENAASGWIEELPCSQKKDWGMCLPAGKTITSISLGGKREFTNVGEYIQTVYNYALSIAAILAVIMIIVAGVQWVTSGGNSEQITSARKRIVGSIVGLLIAYLSFVILNTINPALVNMRLPQAYMIRPYKVPFDFCSSYDKETKFANLENQKTKEPKELETIFAKLEEKAFSLVLPKDANKFKCSTKFFIANSNASVCYGEKCANEGDGCVQKTEEIKKKIQAKRPWTKEDEENDYVCYPAKVIIDISYADGQIEDKLTIKPREGWEADTPVNKGESELWSVCEDGSTTDMTSENFGYAPGGGIQKEYIAADQNKINSAAADCSGKGGLKGFAVMMEMEENWDFTDEEHLIGKTGVDLGDEIYFRKNGGRIPTEYFIPATEIQSDSVVTLTVNAANIKDMDCFGENNAQNPNETCHAYDVYKTILSNCRDCSML